MEAHPEDYWWYWPLQEQKITSAVCPATTPSHNLALSVYLCLKSMGRCYSHLAPPSLGSMLSLRQLQNSFPNLLNLFSPQEPWAQWTLLSFRKIPSLMHDFHDLHSSLCSFLSSFSLCLFQGSVTAPPFSHFQLLFILVPLSSSHDVSAGVFFVSCSFCSVGLVNVSLLSSVQLFCDPEDCSQPGSSVHRIYQQEYWSELPFPPPGIFLTQGLNVSLLHCRQILNC